MILLKAFATAISIAIVLSGAVFPGGAMLCREGNGVSRLEAFHAPHVPDCTPAGGSPDETLDASCCAHGHGLCTDTEASGLQAPVQTIKLRPAADGIIETSLRNDEQPPAAAWTALPCPPAPLIASHISTTILRT